MIRHLVVMLVLASVLAGCSKPQARDEPIEPSSPTQSATSSSTASMTPRLEPSDNLTTPRLQLSQCTGFAGSTTPYPRALGPGTAPPGWEPTDPAVLTSYVGIGAWECNRLSIGPYERGPVRVVWDAHDRADVPAVCNAEKAASTITRILNMLFVDDAELAAYLEGVYGMPVQYSEIEAQAQPSGPLTLRTWTWGPQQTQSDLTFVDDGTDYVWDGGDRFFWQRGDGIGSLDISYGRSGPVYTNRHGYGTMQEPMLLADGTGEFVGPINYYRSLNGEGTFTHYADLECKQVAPTP